MPDSIPIPVDLLAETQAAVEVLICLSSERAPQDCAKAIELSAKLSAVATSSCDKLSGEKRQEGYQLLRHLDEVKRKIKKDYGLEK